MREANWPLKSMNTTISINKISQMSPSNREVILQDNINRDRSLQHKDTEKKGDNRKMGSILCSKLLIWSEYLSICH